MLKLLTIAGVVYLCVRLARALGLASRAKKARSERAGTVDKDRAVDAEFEEI